MFNTNSLAYKLRHGKLKDHSEQMNKWLAGFIDADGSISILFKKHDSNSRYGLYLQLSVSQSASNDPDFELLRSLSFYYNLGKVYFENRDSEIKRSSSAVWRLDQKDSLILLSRILKHLRIKATHADNLMWLVCELKGISLDEKCIDEIKEFIICSRDNSRWLKMPKHPSWAWLAGYLDGDGHYRCRLNRVKKVNTGMTTGNELKLFVGASLKDSFILNFLHVHLKGSIRDRADGVRFWQRSLGRNSASFAIPFIKQMLEFSNIPKKYETLQRMLNFHTTRRD